MKNSNLLSQIHALLNRGNDSGIIDSEFTIEFTPFGPISGSSVKANIDFVAADTGRQPTKIERNEPYPSGLSMAPNLVGCEYSIIGEKSKTYNCVAWSVGDPLHWYELTRDQNYPEDFIIIDEYLASVLQIDIEEIRSLFPTEIMRLFYVHKLNLDACNVSDRNVSHINFYGVRDEFHDYGEVNNMIGHVSVLGGEKPYFKPDWYMFESKLGTDFLIQHIMHQLDGIPDEETQYGEPTLFFRPVIPND